jgi:hypothetical protein
MNGTTQPAYFSVVEQSARDTWQLLESRPDIKGTWDQLFRQVQSTKHVVSELLQNADDAGATEAFVSIANETFYFAHTGEDFIEEQLASLCRFGYSNKRHLHMIGFRGIGFKSTFSIGDVVHLATPSLGLKFHNTRFTLPVWDGRTSSNGLTEVTIAIREPSIAASLLESMEDWRKSPTSILFFRHLNSVSINGNTVEKVLDGAGPTRNSNWYVLREKGKDKRKVLVIRSDEVAFPPNAEKEIRAERSLTGEDFTIPPCQVELVLDPEQESRFYVVLPTGHTPDITVSVNAPFIQDPARTDIKDPPNSPTNRWLVQRAASLLASTYAEWVQNKNLSIKERAEAYSLMPAAKRRGFFYGQQSFAEKIFELTFDQVLKQTGVLGPQGFFVDLKNAVFLPKELYSIWDAEVLEEHFLEESEGLVCPSIPEKAVEALESRHSIESNGEGDILEFMKGNEGIPKPGEFSQLALLWEFVQEAVGNAGEDISEYPIIPVRNETVLYPASRVIRIASRFERFSDLDAQFLLRNIKDMDPDWNNWVNDVCKGKSKEANMLKAVMKECGYSDTARPDTLAIQSARNIFSQDEPVIADCVRVTRILAELNADIPDDFRYVTRNGQLTEVGEVVSYAEYFGLDEFLPEKWTDEHCLHSAYFGEGGLRGADMERWCLSGKSRLIPGIPIEKSEHYFHNQKTFETRLQQLGGRAPASYHYRSSRYNIETYDFPKELVAHLEHLRRNDPTIWRRVLAPLLLAGGNFQKLTSVTAYHVSTQRTHQRLDCGILTAEWIHRFQHAKCLPDDRGDARIPAELMLRTPDTEAFRDMESFVSVDLDNEHTRSLLKLLGACDKPGDFYGILKRLSSLRAVPNILNHLEDVRRCYAALDKVVLRSSSEQVREIAAAFEEQSLVLTEDGSWMEKSAVSVLPGDETTAANEVVHSLFRELPLWDRLNVVKHPSFEKTLEWLSKLKAGEQLPPEALRKVKQSLPRDPERVWHSCGCWLAMNGSWQQVGTLMHRISKQFAGGSPDLFPAIQASTADFRMLSMEALKLDCWSSLQEISEQLSPQVTACEGNGSSEDKPEWLDAISEHLRRIRNNDVAVQERLRKEGRRLYRSEWVEAARIEVTPHLNGSPAGPPHAVKVAWIDETVFVQRLSSSKLVRPLTEEFAQAFQLPKIRDAFLYCAGRDPQEVKEFLAESFEFDLLTDEKGSGRTGKPGGEKSPSGAVVGPAPDLGEGDDDPDLKKGEETGGTTQGEPISKRKITPPRYDADPLFAFFRQQMEREGFIFNPRYQVFTRKDGRGIEHIHAPFKGWQKDGEDGQFAARYLFVQETLDRGFEFGADVWRLIDQDPHRYFLVMPKDGEFLQILPGSELTEMVQLQLLKLHPLKYFLSADGTDLEERSKNS